ncbi:MAG: dodecin family protein [Desulfarculaceae bacterium]|nr:dodecin family protein [Desulfarculaceae bacterium]MCF8074226.1 dodecin family protein [Desulfarculaceae bacterium]MCF8103015.1 dodecin family protein [Desulfarculaceae bacterium]MCF8117146.1 dodecin family protein [Desulfarculaceae bacterium]
MGEKRVARVTEIIAGSPISFDDAIAVGIARASATLRGITGFKVAEQNISLVDGKVMEYRVRLEVIFVLES